MSKPNRARYKMAEVHAQFAEAVGGEDVEFETADGSVFTFPHPLFADSEYAKAIDDAEDDAAKARVLLGDDQYEKYKAAGGTDNDISLLFLAVQQDSQGQIKKRPTRR